MKTAHTYTAEIYCSLRHHYNTGPGSVIPWEEATAFISNWTRQVKICVTVTATDFFHADGSEPGFIVGFINYPRFPASPEEIETKAIDLAKLLCVRLQQYRVSIVLPDKTIMVEEGEDCWSGD